MPLIEIAAVVAAIVIAFVVWRAWPEQQRENPPWAMREFHRRTDPKPPHEGSEKLGAKDD